MSRATLPLDAFQPPGCGRSILSRSWLVDGLLESRGACLLIGEPGSGKSLIACEIARCVATGEQFFGRTVRRGAVAYLAAEREGEIHLRLKAAFEGWSGETNIRITGHAKALFSGGQKAVDDLIEHINALSDVREIGEPVRLIVIDTLGVAMRGLDENSNRDAEVAWALIERLRDGTNAAVLIVHHAKREESRSRGAQAFEASSDVVVLVKRPGRGSSHTLKVVKANGVEEGQALSFGIDVKRLTPDPETGGESSVAFAVMGGDSEAAVPSASADGGEGVREVRLSSREKTAIQILIDHTRTGDLASFDKWKQDVDEALKVQPRNRWRQAWLGIHRKLEENNLIAIEGTGKARTVRLIEALESNASEPNALKACSAR